MISSHQGVTLVELLVVLVLLSLMAGIVGLSWRAPELMETPAGDRGAIAAARRRAAATGALVPVVTSAGAASVELLALPDGRLVGPAGAQVDPLANR